MVLKLYLTNRYFSGTVSCQHFEKVCHEIFDNKKLKILCRTPRGFFWIWVSQWKIETKCLRKCQPAYQEDKGDRKSRDTRPLRWMGLSFLQPSSIPLLPETGHNSVLAKGFFAKNWQVIIAERGTNWKHPLLSKTMRIILKYWEKLTTLKLKINTKL